jgi:uncharacterized membrane protein YedE/YeeE
VSGGLAECGTRCRVMSLVFAAAAGALFGAGLLLAGMTQPARVIGFLDITRAWDPTLAFVMGGAVTAYAVASRLVRWRRAEPWFDIAFHLPTRRDLDVRLLAGAAIFGVGWGLGGLCPGPALVAAGSGAAPMLGFVGAMLLGMFVHRRLASR